MISYNNNEKTTTLLPIYEVFSKLKQLLEIGHKCWSILN